MRLLLDTHAFLWFIAGDTQLSYRARQLIEDQANTRFLSVASLWEMAIKHNTGKLPLGEPFEPFMQRQLAHNSILVLGITISHTAAVAQLPFFSHHRDPFDRMIIAQAQVEQLTIVTRDPNFPAYSVAIVW